MTYIITSQCIECYRCESICPTGAITRQGQKQFILAERCNDCAEDYTVPQCWAICPTADGCIPDLSTIPKVLISRASGDYWETWFEVYNRLISRLKSNQQSDYWQRWFTAYSQSLVRHLHTTPAGVKA